MRPLKLIYLWQVIGSLGICFIIYLSLIKTQVQLIDIDGGDKIGHFTAYFLISAWFSQLYSSQKSRIFLILFLLSLGLGMEILQSFLSYRQGDMWDMLANSLGVIIASLACWKAGGRLLLKFENLIINRHH